MATDVKKTHSVRPRYGYWQTRSNAGIRRPSKLPFINRRQTPALKLLPFGSLHTMVRKGRGEFGFFFLNVGIFLTSAYVWRRRQKKPELSPSIPHHCICSDPEGNNFNDAIRHLSIKESFDGRRTPAFMFLTQSASDHTTVSQTVFFFQIEKKNWFGRPWYGHWQTRSVRRTPTSRKKKLNSPPSLLRHSMRRSGRQQF